MSPIAYHFEENHPLSTRQFCKSLTHLMGNRIVTDNRISELKNGDVFFPVIIEAIESAQTSINFETFIYWEGGIAKKFTNVLCEAAERGVTCNLVLDGFGAKRLPSSDIERMRDCGINIAFFRPLTWKNFWRLRWHNHRTHRKLLIIDGKRAFIGGMGIADHWTGHAQDPNHWRDTQFEMEGPMVSDLQGVFLDNWILLTGKVLRDVSYFPDFDIKGQVDMQLVKSFPSDGCSNLRLLILSLCKQAKHSLAIATPYFLPDSNARAQLIAACQRGVRVQILTNAHHIDKKIAWYASRYYWEELLDGGIEIYTYEPTMIHLKTMIVDEEIASIGSSNLDYRSIFSNYEANVTLFDSEFVACLRQSFTQDIERSARVDLKDIKHRPVLDRFKDFACARLRYLL